MYSYLLLYYLISLLPLRKNHTESTCGPHVFTCVPHAVFQFHTFIHMWWQIFICETHVRSGKHMWISCVPHVTRINSHVTTMSCEAHVGSYLLVLRSHVKRTCEIGTTLKIHMWIWCDFFVKLGTAKNNRPECLPRTSFWRARAALRHTRRFSSSRRLPWRHRQLSATPWWRSVSPCAAGRRSRERRRSSWAPRPSPRGGQRAWGPCPGEGPSWPDRPARISCAYPDLGQRRFFIWGRLKMASIMSYTWDAEPWGQGEHSSPLDVMFWAGTLTPHKEKNSSRSQVASSKSFRFSFFWFSFRFSFYFIRFPPPRSYVLAEALK